MSAPATERPAAWLIAGASLLTVLFMAMHPSVQAPSLSEAIGEMVREGAVNRMVHSILIALIVLTAFGFMGLARHLGPGRPLVAAGFAAYAFAVVMELGAAIVNGLAVSSFVAKLTQATPEQLEAARPVLTFAFSLNQGFAQTGVMAFAAAMACWSAVLVRQTGFGRWVGGLGLAAGAAEAVGLMSGYLQLNVHGMGAVVALQTLWNLGVAFYLARGAAPATLSAA